MQREISGAANAGLRDRSDTYLDAVTDCVGTLPAVLSGYRTADGSFEAAVDRLSERESACDDHLAGLRRRLGRSRSPEFTAAYLLAGEFVTFYAAVDEVPNRAERLALELAAVEPAVPVPVLDALQELVGYAVGATDLLADLVGRYVAEVEATGGSVAVADGVERIRRLERHCDDLKYDAMATAFEVADGSDALCCRRLLCLADEVANAAEDAADHLVYLNSVTV